MEYIGFKPSIRPSLGPRRKESTAKLGGVRKNAVSHADDEIDDECPMYSAVRVTKDGQSYVLQKSKTSRGRSVLTRRFCRERKSPAHVSKPSLPSNVLKQGEYI